MDQKISSNRKLIAIVAGLLLLFLLGSVFSNLGSGGDTTAPEYSPSNTPAVIGNSDKLYKEINNSMQFMNLRQDIATYGRLSIPSYYNNPETMVSFTTTGAFELNDSDLIKFSGSYIGSKDKIVVTVERLPNNQIKTSIVNSQNGGMIDSRLPSNSSRNQFLASLPIKNASYIIEYNQSVDAYIITALKAESGIKDQAISLIEEKTGYGREGLKTLFKPFIY